MANGQKDVFLQKIVSLIWTIVWSIVHILGLRCGTATDTPIMERITVPWNEGMWPWQEYNNHKNVSGACAKHKNPHGNLKFRSKLLHTKHNLKVNSMNLYHGLYPDQPWASPRTWILPDPIPDPTKPLVNAWEAAFLLAWIKDGSGLVKECRLVNKWVGCNLDRKRVKSNSELTQPDPLTSLLMQLLHSKITHFYIPNYKHTGNCIY